MKYLQQIQKDHEKRIENLKESFDRLKDTPVMIKIMELNEINSTEVYSLFKKIYYNVNFKTLEDMENLLSIVGNFYDDNYLNVIWEFNESTINVYKSLNRELTDDKKDPHLVWSHDDDPGLTEEELVKLLDQIIKEKKEYKERCEKIFDK